MFCAQNNQKVLVSFGKKGKKALKRRRVCIGKIKRAVNMICARLVLEICLLIEKFPVGSLVKISLICKFSVVLTKKCWKRFNERLREMVKQPEDQFYE